MRQQLKPDTSVCVVYTVSVSSTISLSVTCSPSSLPVFIPMTLLVTLVGAPSFIWTNWILWQQTESSTGTRPEQDELYNHHPVCWIKTTRNMNWTSLADLTGINSGYFLYLNSSNLLLTKPLKWWDQHIICVLDLRWENSNTTVSSVS